MNLVKVSKVEDFEFGSLIKLTAQVSLSKIFPKLQRLRVGVMHENTSSLLSEQFPNLIHLHIKQWDSPHNKDDIASIFRLNPQLRSFKIYVNKFNFLHDISDHLQSIEYLEIVTEKRKPYRNVMYFRNVEKFTINYKFCGQWNNRKVPQMPF